MKAQISATIYLVPHPEPSRLTDVWAKSVVDEILKQESKAKIKREGGMAG